MEKRFIGERDLNGGTPDQLAISGSVARRGLNQSTYDRLRQIADDAVLATNASGAFVCEINGESLSVVATSSHESLSGVVPILVSPGSQSMRDLVMQKIVLPPIKPVAFLGPGGPSIRFVRWPPK